MLDRPSPPTGPVEFSNITGDCVTLNWLAPEFDGCAPINNYVVMKREKESSKWVEVAGAVTRTTLKVSRLERDQEYVFRIFAENRFGRSNPLDSEAVLVAFPFKPPSAPGMPEIVKATSDSITLNWDAPADDGGK